MCRLAIITGPVSRGLANAFLAASNALFKDSQRDGFGFAAFGENRGEVCTGRYLNPASFAGFHGARFLPKRWVGTFEETGSMPTNGRCIIAHGRTATCRISLENVHPFAGKRVTLAHNGVLSWTGKGQGPFAETRAGSDSEAFHRWLEQGHDPMEAHKVWGGWGAIPWWDHEEWAMRLLVCEGSSLYVAPRARGGMVFSSTRSDLSELLASCRIATSGNPIKVPASFTQFDPKGRVFSEQPFDGFGRVRSAHLYSSYFQSKPDAVRPVDVATGKRRMRRKGDLFPDWDPDLREEVDAQAALDQDMKSDPGFSKLLPSQRDIASAMRMLDDAYHGKPNESPDPVG